MKTCTKCRLSKPLSEFHRNASCKDGHRPRCKACVAGQPPAARPGDPPPLLHPLYGAFGKTCSRCCERLPAANFSAGDDDRLLPWCKACVKAFLASTGGNG